MSKLRILQLMRAELGRLKYENYLTKEQQHDSDNESDDDSQCPSTSNASKMIKNSEDHTDVLKELEKIRSEVKLIKL